MSQIIWTKHLQERIKERQVDPYLVDKTIRFPDHVEKSKSDTSSKHIKNFAGFQIVATVKRQGNDWIVTSVWKKSGNNHYTYQKPLLEKLVYSLVISIEKLIRRSLNR